MIEEYPNPDKGMWYLASPYSTPKVEGRDILDLKEERHEAVQKAGAELYGKGYCLYEPIASSHFKALKYSLPGTYEYWMKRDRAAIDSCVGVIVLDIEGWMESTGVTDEIAYAKELGKPVWLVRFRDVTEPPIWICLHHVTYVSERDFQWIQNLCENPPEPSEALKKLFSTSNEDLLKETKMSGYIEPKWTPKIEKARLDLNPVEAEYAQAAAFEDGSMKYGEHSWEINGFSIKERCIAIKRHANRIIMGELIAPDSGIPHSAHIQADSAMITTAYLRGMKDKDG